VPRRSLPAAKGIHPSNVGNHGPADGLAAIWAQAIANHQAGRFADATACYDRMLARGARFPEIHNNRGLALAELGRYEEAEAAYRRALAIKPDNPEALCNFGLALAELGRFDEAEAAFRRAIAISPGFAGAYNNLGLILKERGQLAEAAHAIEQAIRLSPKDASYYDNLAATKSLNADDPHVTALDAMAAEAATLSAANRMHLHFALAKAGEHHGDWDNTFRHLLAANALKRATIAYDEAPTLAKMERTCALFTRQFISEREGSGTSSAVPIFIIGMPRSGTTLIEQILASHPAIYGGGELSLFEQALDVVAGVQRSLFPDLAADLTTHQLRSLGELYLQKLLPRVPGAVRITDKMPANFLYAGLIHLALPGATIIHAVRDPVDTCVSCFSVHFTRGQAHTYDLAELGRFYRHYEALMAHWRRVLPFGRIIDVHYEDLVADLEGVSRRLIARCGLPWDPRCLDFCHNNRPVRTASAVQVRQPVYRSSVGRGHRYGKFLGPLLAELTQTNDAIVSPLRKAG